MKPYLAILGAFLAAGCASAQTEKKTSPHAKTAQTDIDLEIPRPGQAETTREAALTPETTRPSYITRQDLDAFLAAGPAAILAAVDTEPVRKNGRFVGFRITRFLGVTPKTIDLRAGDVILKANGKTIERPENYYAVFEDLKIATQIRLEVLRQGEIKTLIYPIHNASNSDIFTPSTPPTAY